MRHNDKRNNNNNYNGGINERDKILASVKFKSLKFEVEWITKGATPAMVKAADEAGKYMAENGLTSSKIRAIYGEIKRIQMKGFEEEKTAFYLIKPKVAYAVGREKQTNKNNMEGLLLFQLIFNQCFQYVTNDATYKNFSNLMEAILAYHKAYVDPKKDK